MAYTFLILGAIPEIILFRRFVIDVVSVLIVQRGGVCCLGPEDGLKGSGSRP